MRCERCKFENIPGQKRCVKCGAVLEIDSSVIDVHPPRMPSWKKPFRSTLRLARQGKLIPQQNIKLQLPPWMKEIFSDSLLGLFLSIIPGLAHIVQNRFKEIRWYFFAWLTLILSALFLYGSTAGFICLGLAIGIHAGIALQYGLLKDLANIREKIATFILVLIVLTLAYRFAPRVLFPYVTGGYSNLTVPYHNVKAGDYLLARRISEQGNLLPRGSLVLIRPVILTGYESIAGYGRDTIIGEIVGLAGEQVQIDDGVFAVNGQQLDTEKYLVPHWLRGMNFSVTVPQDSYFVSVQYNINAHGITLSSTHISQVCLVKASEIEARAFMRWWPLSRRGFIR